MRRRTAGRILLGTGIAFVAASVALTFAKVGSATTTKVARSISLTPRSTTTTVANNVPPAAPSTPAATSGGSMAAPSTPATSSAPIETPAQFLANLATALHNGDAAFLYDRLNPAVIAGFSEAACRSHAAQLRDPTANFQIISVGAPTDYTFVAGAKSVVVPGTYPIQATVTEGGKSGPVTVHITPDAAGRFTYFTHCS